LTIVLRTEKKSTHFPLTVDLAEDATVNDLKKAIHKQIKKFYPDRQRLTYTDKVLDDGKKQLSDYGIKNEEKILFKDLGMVECERYRANVNRQSLCWFIERVQSFCRPTSCME